MVILLRDLIAHFFHIYCLLIWTTCCRLSIPGYSIPRERLASSLNIDDGHDLSLYKLELYVLYYVTQHYIYLIKTVSFGFEQICQFQDVVSLESG